MRLHAQVAALGRPFAGAAVVAIAAAVLAVAPRPSSAQEIVDSGRFIISQKGRPIRAEEFTFQDMGDSLVVTSNSWLLADPAVAQTGWLVDSTTRTGSFDKGATLVLSSQDYGLREYWSAAAIGADTMRRSILVGAVGLGVDTAYTSYREFNGAGTADRLMLPPGRVFVLDQPLFTTFNVIVRSLAKSTFDSRPITMMVLGARDSVLEATVTHLGTETIRWGARPVVARKLRIADTRTAFTAWATQDGRLLRLQQPEAAITLERLAPKVPAVRTRPPRAR